MRLASTGSDSDQQDQRADPPPPPSAAHVAPILDVAQRALSDGSPKSRGSRSSGMSLAQLTAESLQKIHHDAFELLRFSETFPQGATSFSSQGDVGAAMSALHPASRSALLAMGKSSDGIASEIRHMTALAAQAGHEATAQQAREGADEATSSHRRSKKQHDQNDAQGGPSQSRRRRKSSMVRLTCHECHRVETPQWRTGPDGPETLCNVCGLIYAKRKRKRKEAGSCAISWPS